MDSAIHGRDVLRAIGQPLAAALLVGGYSTRMGRDKAWLPWRGAALWEVQLGKLIELRPARLLIACREEQQIAHTAAESLHDPPGNQGPLPVLARCLEHVQMPLLVLAVDMPMVSVGLLQTLVEHCRSGCGAIFCGEHGYEPLCALYPIEVLPLVRESLASGNLRMQTFAQCAVDAGCLQAIPLAKDLEELFSNLNTPADLSWMPPPLSQ